ncbi:urease accessory protein UreD [Saccharopolyspora erythraea]|uniref:urease accessory protein UreD n=1 Tax=Saccharopolyspora erythraea TaxID=1836 RepID=UPI001E3FD74D|nr:urease accessory protein UreD [Saccharopolyspora erythraea]
MSAPLGGDRLAIDVSVEAGAQLEITTAAATLALRGATTDHATYDVTLTVGEQATLYWLPQPLISTRGSNLRQTYTVDLAPTARLILREELILGRAHEPPGDLSSHLTVHRDGRPLLAQHTTFGSTAPGWDGPAVLGEHRATGQILIVDPAFANAPARHPSARRRAGQWRGHCRTAGRPGCAGHGPRPDSDTPTAPARRRRPPSHTVQHVTDHIAET